MRRAQAILLFLVLLWQAATGVAVAGPPVDLDAATTTARAQVGATCHCCDCGGTACCLQRRPERPPAESPNLPARGTTSHEGLSAPEPPALADLLALSFRFLPLPSTSPAVSFPDAASLPVRFCCLLI